MLSKFNFIDKVFNDTSGMAGPVQRLDMAQKKYFEDVRVLKSHGFKFPIFLVLIKKINKLFQLRKI